MPIQVIGAGLGRTGTLSLKIALEKLGFGRCYHMSEVFAHPEHVRVWDAAARGEPVDWDALFQDYQATVDWPGCNFCGEYLRLYPEAKVILTVRDPQRWYESARQTIYYARSAFFGGRMPVMPRMRRFQMMLDRLIWDGMFAGRFEDEAFALEVFRNHNETVRRMVPPDRLLVYEVKEGWGPLCAFLGVPVPEGTPFPHVNDTKEFRSRIRRIALVMRGVGVAALAALAAAIVGIAWLVHRLLG